MHFCHNLARAIRSRAAKQMTTTKGSWELRDLHIIIVYRGHHQIDFEGAANYTISGLVVWHTLDAHIMSPQPFFTKLLIPFEALCVHFVLRVARAVALGL